MGEGGSYMTQMKINPLCQDDIDRRHIWFKFPSVLSEVPFTQARCHKILAEVTKAIASFTIKAFVHINKLKI